MGTSDADWRKLREQRNDEPLHMELLNEDGDRIDPVTRAKLPPPPQREWTMLEDGTMIRTDDLKG